MHNIPSVSARVTLLAIRLKLKVAIVQATLHQCYGCPWPAQGAPAGGIAICGAEEFSDLSGFAHGTAVALPEEGCDTAVDAVQGALVGWLGSLGTGTGPRVGWRDAHGAAVPPKEAIFPDPLLQGARVPSCIKSLKGMFLLCGGGIDIVGWLDV